MGPISRIPFRDILHSGLDYTENLPHLLVDRVFSAIDKKDLSSVIYLKNKYHIKIVKFNLKNPKKWINNQKIRSFLNST